MNARDLVVKAHPSAYAVEDWSNPEWWTVCACKYEATRTVYIPLSGAHSTPEAAWDEAAGKLNLKTKEGN